MVLEEFIKNKGLFPEKEIKYKTTGKEERFNGHSYYDPWKGDFFLTYGFEAKDGFFQRAKGLIPGDEITFDVTDFVKVSCYLGAYYNYLVPVASFGKFKFVVYLDDEKVFETKESKCDGPVEYMELNVASKKELQIKCISLSDKWQKETFIGNMIFTKESGEEIYFGEAENNSLFSFDYNGVSSKEFLSTWDCDWKEEKEGDVSVYTVSYKDTNSSLRVICRIYHYERYNVFWQKLYFENVGLENSGKISNISFVDYNLTTSKNVSVVYANGSDATEYDFMQRFKVLDSQLHLDTYGGRPSSRYLPYFRIDDVDMGYLCGIGWSGDWIADITKIEKGVNVKSGLTNFNSYLKPKEKIMVGGFAIMEYRGDIPTAHNNWRRFMFEYNTPKIKGEHFRVPLCYVPWGSTHEDVHAKYMDIMKEERLKIDYYWIDAGWYGNIEGLSETCFDAGWGDETGNWYPNPGAYPSGMEKTSKRIHDNGMKMVMWIEPVRARNNTQIVNDNPQYFYALDIDKKNEKYDYILSLWDDEACDFCIDFLDKKIKDYGIDCYEEDFNINPKAYWVQKDKEDPDRTGMAEVKFVTNHWGFWDTVRERNPHIFIINCASGGRKLDMETVGRGVAMWRSDYGCYVNYDHSAIQNQTMSLMPWVPLHSAGIKTPNGDMYDFRSSLSTGSILINLVTDYDYDFERKMLNEYHFMQKYMYGDFWPIIQGGLDKTMWNAYQMALENEGAVLAYRQDESSIDELKVTLKGVNPDKEYIVRDLDTNDTQTIKGFEAFNLKIENKREAKVFVYKEL